MSTRWPLVFRFIKGAIHANIVIPVVLHALLTTLIVCLDVYLDVRADLPSSIVSLKMRCGFYS